MIIKSIHSRSKQSPKLMNFQLKSFPVLIRKYVTQGFKVMANYTKQPSWITDPFTPSVTSMEARPTPIQRLPVRLWVGGLTEGAILHVISLIKLHCRWVSSRGHMRISVDCDMERMEDHRLNIMTQKRPPINIERQLVPPKTRVCADWVKD